jgi:hypothetical protein
MADQTKEQVKKQLENSLGNDEQQLLQPILANGVTLEQLDAWKEKYKEIHIVTVHLNEHESLTGYFKKPGRDVMANVVNLNQDKKVYEAREFLLLNTFIGGDKAITTNYDASITAQTKLWTNLNFLTAEATKY